MLYHFYDFSGQHQVLEGKSDERVKFHSYSQFKTGDLQGLVSACVDVSMNGYIVAVSLAGGVVEEVRG